MNIQSKNQNKQKNKQKNNLQLDRQNVENNDKLGIIMNQYLLSGVNSFFNRPHHW